MAILVFGPDGKWKNGAGRVGVTGFTDNLSNAYLLDRFLTTRFPLSLVLMELAKQLEDFGLDLSKGRYERFEMRNRVVIEMENTPFKILRKMLEAAMEFDNEIKERRTSKETNSAANKIPAGQKLQVTQPW